jgi:hypothetical protein
MKQSQTNEFKQRQNSARMTNSGRQEDSQQDYKRGGQRDRQTELGRDKQRQTGGQPTEV